LPGNIALLVKNYLPLQFIGLWIHTASGSQAIKWIPNGITYAAVKPFLFFLLNPIIIFAPAKYYLYVELWK